MTTAGLTLTNPKSRLESPLIWLLSLALITGPLIVLRQNTSATFWSASIWVYVIVVTWSVFAGQLLIREPVWQQNATAFRLAELVLIAILLRISVWWLAEGFPTSAEWRLYLASPLSILSGLWWLYFVFAVGIWLWVNDLIGLFYRLEVSERELNFYRLSPNERRILRETMLLRTDRSTLSQIFFARWMTGAFVLIWCAALSTVNLTRFSETSWFTDLPRYALSPAMLLAILLYFFAGLWLLSYGRYTAKYARWLTQGTQPHASVARAWRRNSLLLLVSIGIIASFFPIGSTVPIAVIVETVVWAVATVVYFIINLLVLLFALFASFLSGGEEAGEAPAEEFAPPPAAAPDMFEPLAGTSPIPPEVLGGVTWLVFAVGVGFAMLFLWRRIGGQAGFWPLVQQLHQRMREWWQLFWHGIQDQITEVRIFVAERFGREGPLRRNDPRRRIDPSRLGAREQIRYFYLRTVQRAQEKGLTRRPHQTPAEFLADLQDEWPESSEDSADITKAFLDARYSPSQVPEEQINPIKEVWMRMRRALKKRKRK